MGAKQFYQKNYKLLMIVPLVLILASLFVIFSTYKEIGDIVDKDVSLKGGFSLTINSDADITGLEEFLTREFNQEFIVRKLTEFGSDKQVGFIVEADADIDEVEIAIEERLNIDLNKNNLSVEITSSSLGDAFYRQMLKAILIAFALMAIVIFITFRNFIPSMAVIISGLFDIIVTLAVINVIGLKISTAGVAALLLILGYSIDTDVVLTTRVLKRKEGTVDARILNAMKTGLTMTITTFTALLIGYLIATSFVLKEMFLIILIGLAVDVIITWLFNAGVLRWYMGEEVG